MKNRNNLQYKVRSKVNSTDEWIEIDQDQLNSLSLENGDRMPEIQGNKIIITNYFNMFWGRIMGARNYRVFMVLNQFAYGEKDYSYPSLNMLVDICNMAKGTVKAAIEELEQLGFIIQVQVYNTEKRENENNIYILRKTVPFLTVDQYKSLPKKMREEHDKYLLNIEKSERITLSNVPDYSNISDSNNGMGGSKIDTGISSNLGGSNFDPPLEDASVINSKPISNIGMSKSDTPVLNVDTGQKLTAGGLNFDSGVGQKLTPNNYNALSITNLNHLNNHLHSFQNEFMNCMRSQLPVQSYEVWIKNIKIMGFDTERRVMTIGVDNIVQKNWIENRYISLIKDILTKYFGIDEKISINISLCEGRVKNY